MNFATPGLDILATAVLLLDPERHIRYLNPAAENLLGVSAPPRPEPPPVQHHPPPAPIWSVLSMPH